MRVEQLPVKLKTLKKIPKRKHIYVLTSFYLTSFLNIFPNIYTYCVYLSCFLNSFKLPSDCCWVCTVFLMSSYVPSVLLHPCFLLLALSFVFPSNGFGREAAVVSCAPFNSSTTPASAAAFLKLCYQQTAEKLTVSRNSS